MKTVIFDMDGIIFDSERATYNCWKEVAEKYGIKNLDEPYMKCIGGNAERAKNIFLDFYGEDFPYDEYNEEKSRNYHRKYDGGKLPLMKGARELLSFLHNNGYYVALASSTRFFVVNNQIIDAGLSDYFNCIIAGDMVEKSKPDPDIFLKAAEKSPFKESIVIEDSYNGIRAAKKAEMTAIMVPDMLAPDDEMKELADYILPSLYEVKKMIENGEL